MANCKQAASLSGTIYQEATVGAKNPNGRICVKISIPEDAGQNETTWHNCYYFTSSEHEVEYLKKMLVARAAVHMQGQFRFRKKRHDEYPVDIFVPAFFVDSLTVLYSPAMQDRPSATEADTDPFMDDDPISQGASAPPTPAHPRFNAPRGAQQNSGHQQRPAPAPAPAVRSVASAAPVAANAYPGKAPVLNF